MDVGQPVPLRSLSADTRRHTCLRQQHAGDVGMITPDLRQAGAPVEHERWIAGGTTLVDLMKLGVERPTGLVDLGARRGELAGISETSDGLTLGAMTTMAEAERDPRLREQFPAAHLALFLAASPQIREMATLGGNLLQRTRCPYFREGRSACNKRKPGSGCAAIGNPREPSAILGLSEYCVATYPGDLAVALRVLDATLSIEASGGAMRRIPLSELHRLPGYTPDIESTLEPGDLITGIHLPNSEGAVQTYVKLRERASYAFASASAAVSLKLSGATVASARIAIGGLATVPWRCEDAEEWLRGRRIDTTSAMEAGHICLESSTS